MAEAERAQPRAVRKADAGRAETALTSWIARGFSRFEDVVYVGLAVMLAVIAVGLLVDAVVMLVRAITEVALVAQATMLLDRLLLILMIVELLYTVQVSLREHTLVPEPFLVVGLIAAIRRILVLTAEFAEMAKAGGDVFRNAMMELGLLTVLVLGLVSALAILRRRATAERKASD